MALLTGFQFNLTGESRPVAPSFGAVSTGPSVEQFCAGGMVKRDFGERTDGHPSNTASTRHSTTPGGMMCVIAVSVVVSAGMLSPFSGQRTRYSVPFATALQPNVTWALVGLVRSAGVGRGARELGVGGDGRVASVAEERLRVRLVRAARRWQPRGGGGAGRRPPGPEGSASGDGDPGPAPGRACDGAP